MVLKRKKDFGKSEVLRAIDGARTRGLDLGKVARYQLRHYRTSGWWESNPRIQLGRLVFYHWTTPAEFIGVTGFEPATSWSQTRRSSQAEPHPGISYVPVSPVAQCLLYYKVFRLSIFFLHFFIFLMTFYFILFLHAISRLLLCRTFRQSKYFWLKWAFPSWSISIII